MNSWSFYEIGNEYGTGRLVQATHDAFLNQSLYNASTNPYFGYGSCNTTQPLYSTGYPNPSNQTGYPTGKIDINYAIQKNLEITYSQDGTANLTKCDGGYCQGLDKFKKKNEQGWTQNGKKDCCKLIACQNEFRKAGYEFPGDEKLSQPAPGLLPPVTNKASAFSTGGSGSEQNRLLQEQNMLLQEQNKLLHNMLLQKQKPNAEPTYEEKQKPNSASTAQWNVK